MKEWKTITNFTNYEISNIGEVRKKKSQKLLKFNDNGKGYLAIKLTKNGKRITNYQHKLVAEAFILNPNNKLEVNHKDKNRRNNHISNLEWVTRSENMKHCFKTIIPIEEILYIYSKNKNVPIKQFEKALREHFV